MKLDEVKDRLRALGQADVEALLAQFQRETGSADPDRFLRYLRERDLISGSLFSELHAGDEIVVSRLVGVKHATLIMAPAAGPAAPTLMAEGNAAAAPTLAAPGADAAPPAAPAAPAATRYLMLGRLGKGAMGEVQIARDEELLRKVAYKRMVPEVAARPALAARFFKEIQVNSQLDHPNVVPIYGIEVAPDGSIGYAMKLVQGKTLHELLEEDRRAVGKRRAAAKDEPARLAARLDAFLKVADAMAYAHSKGVLHRDLKPENIMIGRYNQVYVMDWGICRLIGARDEEAVDDTADADAQTRYGALLGTPAYMSPEQAEGKNPELDERSDLCALGLILFEVVTLNPAYTGDTLEVILARAKRAAKNPLQHRDRRVRIAPELAAIIHKATALAPAARYPTVVALAEDLRRFLRGDAVRARKDSLLSKAGRWMSRHRNTTLFAMLLLLLAGAGIAIVDLLRHKAAIVREHRRQQRLEDFVSAVSLKAHDLDDTFEHDEDQLQQLVGRAEELVARVPPGHAPYLVSADFRDPAHKPPDAAYSKHYQRDLSLAAPVCTMTGAPPADQPSLHLLAQLGPRLRDLVLASGGPGTDADRLRDQGLPLFKTFITLTSGAHCAFPAWDAFPDGYDALTRPKYVLAAGKPGTRWGNPYPDLHGEILLPCAAALTDDQGGYLGVAGIDVSFDWLRQHLLELTGVPAARREYLADDQGNAVILAGSEGSVHPDLTPAPEGDLENRPIPLTPLPYPELVTAIRGKRSGDVALADDHRIAVLFPVESLGWYYVVIADRDALLRD